MRFGVFALPYQALYILPGSSKMPLYPLEERGENKPNTCVALQMWRPSGAHVNTIYMYSEGFKWHSFVKLTSGSMPLEWKHFFKKTAVTLFQKKTLYAHALSFYLQISKSYSS